jgi:predicted metalloendopeptidase
MVDTILTAFSNRLHKLQWMDDSTKKGAFAKVNTLVRKIGYPDKWRSYDNVTIGENFLENYLAVSKDEAHQEFIKFSTPVDKTKWHMKPSDVNAYYSPSSNEMAFPAGILQPPFFSKDFPMVMNYGAIGSVVGHELSHAFDDQGSQYDSEGKLNDWFTNSSKTAFGNLTHCYVKQYSQYHMPEIKLAVNGELTLGENIADNAGVQVSFDAYKQWAKANNAPQAFLINGESVSDVQLFWISYGQVWCSKYRPEALMMQVRNDPHSPGKFRTWGPVQNSQDFAKAFKCPANSTMAPAQKCTLW